MDYGWHSRSKSFGDSCLASATRTNTNLGSEKMSVQNLWSVSGMKYIRKHCLGCLLVFAAICFVFFRAYPWQREEPEEQEKYEDPGPYHVAYPRKKRFILDQPKKCSRTNPFVVVIVPVAPHNVEARDAIRSSWGNDSLVQEGVVLVLFLLGVPGLKFSESQEAHLQQENLRHQDLLQSNFIDSYKNLTVKTIVMLEWLRKHCRQAHYAVKVDADILLNIKMLMKMLLRLNTAMTSYITGLVWYGNIVIRDPSHKFYIPSDVYPNSVYPPYPLGMCYIMSLDLPERILQVSKEIKPIFIEDAYIGLCLERLNIAPSDPPDPNQFVVHPPKEYNRCYYTGLIAVLTESPAQLVSYWTDITKPNQPC